MPPPSRLQMDLLTAAVLGRNWYWANNGKCDTLPVAGQTSIMGYTLASDGLLDASSLGLIDGVAQWELRTTVPYGDWFALTSAGTLSGGSPRCDGAYASGSSQGAEVTLTLACAAAPADLTVSLVHGNGYAQTFARSFRLGDLESVPAGPPDPPLTLLPPPSPPPSTPIALPPSALPSAAPHAGTPSPAAPAVANAREDGLSPVVLGVVFGGVGALALVVAAAAVVCARVKARSGTGSPAVGSSSLA